MVKTNDNPNKIAAELEEPVNEARNLALKLGLEPYRVNYWLVDQEEMNELIAYGGFHTRYPHWRWGMKYEKQKKQRQYLGGKAFEIVNHDNPSNAFLQISNTIADQKAVITHVEAHADFFANNEWFHLFHENNINAAEMIERHDERVTDIIRREDTSREEVEKFIDHLLCIEDTIDQYQSFEWEIENGDGEEGSGGELLDDIREKLDVTEEVGEEIFDSEWLEEQREEMGDEKYDEALEDDVLLYLHSYGMQYDEEEERAVEMEDWQKEVIEIVRREAHYFAPQRVTKVMNEGWAAYWESMMMANENFADADEFITYAEHQAAVLGSSGLNPYSLGMQLWEFVENKTNRKEVLDKILRVDGITWRNLFERIDFDEIQEMLQPPDVVLDVPTDDLDKLLEYEEYADEEMIEAAREGEVDVEKYPWKVLSYEGMCARHFSLLRKENLGFMERISMDNLEEMARYIIDYDRYDSVEEALGDVDYSAGWDKMRQIRASHNDITFIDEFLNEEFVRENNYAAYEYSRKNEGFFVSSNDYEAVKKKLLLQFTNFGKPRVFVMDGNFENRGELLLGHDYNGVLMNKNKAKQVLERIFQLWGRPVNLATYDKVVTEEELEIARRREREPEPDEVPILIRYDGMEFEEYEITDEEIVELIQADEIDYDTKPEEWLVRS